MMDDRWPVTRAARVIVALGAALLLGAAPVAVDPFEALAKAYAAKDARAAATSYTADAQLIYAYDGAPVERHAGKKAIERSFAQFFAQFPDDDQLDLNFRVTERRGRHLVGLYRLRIGRSDASYGRFSVDLAANGLFRRDRSGTATRADFEEAEGPVLLEADSEVLDRSYYGLLTGRYRLPDGCEIVVTRSIVRLFARNSCDQSWRGLTRVSGREWFAGDAVVSAKNLGRYRFAPINAGPSAQLEIVSGGKSITAVRSTSYRTEDVTFSAADGTRLGGTLYLPASGGPARPGIVLAHGSGPQDRDGYASIIAVLADSMATAGRVVLAYDKRGSGESGGSGDSAGFDLLAGDAAAAMSFLAARPEVDQRRIGLGGSSQAGWVVARAIAAGAAPADVFLLGAAGTAFTVREQNLYNTEARMMCAGIAEPLRRLALDQQSAFFDALRDPVQAARLDERTAEARRYPQLHEWLMPGREGLDATDAWYTVLDARFDPLPVWKSYRGPATFVFSQHDDSTDSAEALRRLRNVQAKLVVLPDAQHLGLGAASRCDGDLAGRHGFSPALFGVIEEFSRSNATPG